MEYTFTEIIDSVTVRVQAFDDDWCSPKFYGLSAGNEAFLTLDNSVGMVSVFSTDHTLSGTSVTA